jgi:hypothetical protein
MTIEQIVKIKQAMKEETSTKVAMQVDSKKACELAWSRYAEVLRALWPKLSLPNKEIDGTSLKYGPCGARFGVRISHFLARHACEPRIVYYYNSGIVGAKAFEYDRKDQWEARLMNLLASHLED